MFASIYARKSTEQTGVADEHRSVARQVEQARRYAAGKGWLVADEHVFVDDGISGAEFATRPGFVRLMNVLKPKPPFHVLIMAEVSRLGREQIETAYALKQLSQAGVRCFSYFEDRELVLETPTDKFLMAAVTFAAEVEREKARQRTYDAMRLKAQAGHVTGGRVFGYDNIEVRIAGTDGQARRSHVERRINDAEAAIVRRLFELAAQGYGKKRIARTLNEAGALCPRAQQGRPTAWSPSSVFEILNRPIYRGEIVWNAVQKRDRWGRKQPKARPETEGLRLPAPHLRIVTDDLWRAAQTRLSESRRVYLAGTRGHAWGRPVGHVEPKYLLSGFSRCAKCGGSLYVRSRSHGKYRAFFYGCSSYHLRGRAVCDNSAELPIDAANRAVLATLRDDLLQPHVIREAVTRAMEYLKVPESSAQAEREQLETELGTVERELARLTGAVAAGGELPTLLAAMQERERRRVEMTERLQVVQSPARTIRMDEKRLERELRVELDHWRDLLADDVHAARPILSRLLVSRLAFKPLTAGIHAPCAFVGTATLGGLVTGVVGVQTEWRPQCRPVGTKSPAGSSVSRLYAKPPERSL